MLKSFATKSTLCLRQVKAIFALLTQYNIVLDVRWVSTHNNVADLPSRILLKHVYSLPDWLLFDIKRRFVPTLQIFTSSQIIAKQYCSLFQDVRSLGNPFLVDWTPHRVFVFPPLLDVWIRTTVEHIALLPACNVLLLLPAWFNKPYVRTALQMARSVRRVTAQLHHGALAHRQLRFHHQFLLIRICRPR